MIQLTYKHLLALAVLVAVVGLVILMAQQPREAFGSVVITSEYFATSTAANTVFGGFTTGRLIASGPRAFGSLVITGANTGTMNFYDATTTNVNLRTGQKATSTILIASFPASTAAGTYTIDAQVYDGLYLDIIGNAATSTITYR